MPTTLYTSIAEVRSFRPCAVGWKNFINYWKDTPEDQPIAIVDCLKSNPVGDVLWLLGKRRKEIQIAVDFAQWCAEYCKELKELKTTPAVHASVYEAEAYAVRAAEEAAAANAIDAAAYEDFVADTATRTVTFAAAYAAAAYAAAAMHAAASAFASAEPRTFIAVPKKQTEKLTELLNSYEAPVTKG
jgi:hypothetical protein